MPLRKKFSLKVLDPLPLDLMNNLDVECCNLITSESKEFNLIKTKLLEQNEFKTPIKYGNGVLAYDCLCNSDETIMVGQNKTKKSYLIRVVTKQKFELLNRIVRVEARHLLNTKVSVSDAIGGISLEDSTETQQLLENALKAQTTKAKRVKFSISTSKVFQMGTNASSTFIQLQLVKDKSNPSKYCLCLLSKTKETKPQLLTLMNTYNLGLEDIHALSLRKVVKNLEDCELKSLLLRWINKAFSLPSTETMAKRKTTYPTKVLYVQRALSATLKYLADDSLKDEVKTLVIKFQNDLTSSGFLLAGASAPTGAKKGPAKNASQDEGDGG